MPGLDDFDRYVPEHGIPKEHYPAAFALWIAEITRVTLTVTPPGVDGPRVTVLAAARPPRSSSAARAHP